MAHVINERHVKKVTSEELRDQLADDMLQDREELSAIKQRLAIYEETGESVSLEEFEAQLLA